MKRVGLTIKILKTVLLSVMTLNLANCAKDSSSSSTTATTGYYVTNSTCYYNGTAQTSLQTCAGATTTYYGYMNSLCYQVGNGVFQQVSTSYCSSSSSTNYTQQLCNGYFTDGSRWAYCQEGASGSYYNNGVIVMDCTGYTLYNQSMQIIKCL